MEILIVCAGVLALVLTAAVVFVDALEKKLTTAQEELATYRELSDAQKKSIASLQRQLELAANVNGSAPEHKSRLTREQQLANLWAYTGAPQEGNADED